MRSARGGSSGAPPAAPLAAGPGGIALAAGLLLLALALAATAGALRPPAPRPANAEPSQFSAVRALGELAGLEQAAGGPHPVGSAANRRVREWILGELRALRLSPRVRESFACGRYRACAPVANVVVRVPGRSPLRPVLLVAHYDSVPAGPGAADDGSGVAIALEVARALGAAPAERDVVLLLDDGEEIGLAGAEAFLTDPVAREVGAVVNLEARGTEGPSLFFETTGPSAFVAGLLGQGTRMALANSLFPAAYELLPNDTDLTVLRRLHVPGANLAFVGGAVRYHTPGDDLAHLDPGSVQHQGENALALVRSFAASDLERPPPGEAVYFDLLGRALLRVPRRGALPLSLLALACAIAGVAGAFRQGRASPGSVALGTAALPLGLAAACGVGILAGRALGLPPLGRPWVADPAALVGSFFLGGLAAGSLPAALLAGRAGVEGVRLGVALGLSLLAVPCAVLWPGGSHLLFVPALAAAALGLAGGRLGSRFARGADAAAAAASSLVLFPTAWLLYPALGQVAGPLVAACVATAVMPLAPGLADLPRRARVAAVAAPALLAACLASLARLEPAADAESPAHIVLSFREEAGLATARLSASSDLGRLPPRVRAEGGFGASPGPPSGFGPRFPSFEAEVGALGFPGPELAREAIEDTGEHLVFRGRLRSLRGAPEALVAVPPGVAVESFAFDGVAVPPPRERLVRLFGGWAVYRRLALPAEGAEVEMAIAGPGPISVEIADASPGLPPEWAKLAAARSEVATPAQLGDVTMVTRAVRLRAESRGTGLGREGSRGL